MRLIQLTCLTLLTGAILSDFSGGVATAKDQKIPIILDTDVGSAIDDAYALRRCWRKIAASCWG